MIIVLENYLDLGHAKTIRHSVRAGYIPSFLHPKYIYSQR